MINSMTYKGYAASMVFDAEDKIIVGRVQDIDDIISFHGESVAEFESNFHAAIEDYLAASKELGSAPERPASGGVLGKAARGSHFTGSQRAAKPDWSLNCRTPQRLNLMAMGQANGHTGAHRCARPTGQAQRLFRCGFGWRRRLARSPAPRRRRPVGSNRLKILPRRAGR